MGVAAMSGKLDARPGSRLTAANALGLAIALLVAAACVGDAARTVTLDNRLPDTVAVYEGGVFVRDLAPGEKRGHLVMEFEGEEIYEARDAGGTVLASRCFTWNELRQQSMLIVFDSPSAPRGTAGACE
jgi:hypothetical protein